MRAVDTNVLVYAHRLDSPFHHEARALMRRLTESRVQWGLPWPCVFEFFSIVTHPRIYAPPSTVGQAIDQMRAWIDAPSTVLLNEPPGSWPIAANLITSSALVGPAVQDARIAAICLAHNVDALITLDRDFSRFPELRTQNLADA